MARRPEKAERASTGRKCPNCGGPLPPPLADSGPPTARWPHFPFCSKRCQLIDLGRWFNGEYRIAGAPADPLALPDDARED